MNAEDYLPDLEELAAEMGMRIRYEKGDFDGGYCILKDQQIIVVNKKLHASRKSVVIALALGEIGIENLFVKPNLRMFIEDEMVRVR
ncbi:MAG: hypothetical protein KBF97_06565 [Bacteroidetes bacterium]|nr:hypothetical protein [Bacteroidota bacterium]